MPISSENKLRYPANWKTEIRPSILARCDHKCMFCGVDNYAMGVRDADGDFHDCDSMTAGILVYELDYRPLRIILTIAHIFDMNPENCADWNLAALCQRCHNRHDRTYRKENRRRKRAGQQTQMELT